jgi:hypothetical protein
MKNIIVILFIALFYSCQNRSENIKKSESSQSKNEHVQKEQSINLGAIKDSLHLDQIQLLGLMTKNDKTISLLFGEVDDSLHMGKSLFLFPKGSISYADSLILSKFSLPGNEYDISDSLVYNARVFYGNCTKDFPFSVIWVQKAKQNDQKWISSIFVLTPDNPDRLTYTFKEDSSMLKEIEENLKTGNCKEIPGMEIYLEP